MTGAERKLVGGRKETKITKDLTQYFKDLGFYVNDNREPLTVFSGNAIPLKYGFLTDYLAAERECPGRNKRGTQRAARRLLQNPGGRF